MRIDLKRRSATCSPPPQRGGQADTDRRIGVQADAGYELTGARSRRNGQGPRPGSGVMRLGGGVDPARVAYVHSACAGWKISKAHCGPTALCLSSSLKTPD